MPVVVAIAIRYIIMAAVQLGIWYLIEKFGLPLLNKAVQAVMVQFGVSEETAKDIMANKLIVAFEEVGIFAVTLRTKLPIKVAEYLGFTSKGYALRKVVSAAEVSAAKVAISATTKLAATAVEGEAIATIVSASRGINVGTVKTLLNYIFKYAGLTTGIFFAAAQYIDFANWQGPYQKYFQRVLSAFGINPDTPLPKANTISADNWKRLYSVIEELHPLGISYPFSDIDKPYSRANLAELVDQVAANIQKTSGNPTYKNVMALVLPLVQLSGQPEDEAKINALLAGTSQVTSTPTSKATALPTTKVFTGIISQGVVGAGLTFEARPDDLIESVDELKAAAANNLAPFLQALAGKVIYEVKVVASITTKDGFKQTGTAQQIQTGTHKDGSPIYKTVVNKFATLILYILTDKGTRTKITTIVLGPVNSAKLNVQQNDLRTLETALPGIVTTTDIKEIQSIVSPTPVVVTTAEVVVPVAEQKKRLGAMQYYKLTQNGSDLYVAYEWGGNVPFGYAPLSRDEFIVGLKSKLQRANDLAKIYTRIVYQNGGTFRYDSQGNPYIGNEFLDSVGIAALTKQISDVQNKIGVYADSYVSGGFSKFQAYAPTPSEEFYTLTFFNSLPAKEQTRLKALYPTYNFELDTAPAVSAPATSSTQTTSAPKTQANATTLFEWYQAQGQTLPSVSARATMYENFGLGQRTYYTGTTEQNTKLLAALKGGTNVAASSAASDNSHIVDNMYLQV